MPKKKRCELTPEELERARAKDRLRNKTERRKAQRRENNRRNYEHNTVLRKLREIRNREHLNEKMREYRKSKHHIEWKENYRIPPKRIFSRIKTSAKQRNLCFDLEFESVKAMVAESCIYCDGEATGLDRIDSERGYVSDNVMPCCFVCNIMKKNYCIEDFLKGCRNVNQFQNGIAGDYIFSKSWGVSSFNCYKDRAMKKQLPFDIDKDFYTLLKEKQCTYCGRCGPNGMDRIDSTLGYTKDNCVSCCSRCNYMKNRFPTNLFLDHCNKIANRIR